MILSCYATRATHRLHLPALRIPLVAGADASGDRRVLRGRLAGQEHSGQRVLAGHLHPPRRGGLHLRRRDRADRKPGRQAGLAADQAAVSGRRRACSASRPWSTTSRRSPASRTSSTAASTGSSRSACRPIRTIPAIRAASARSCTASAATSTGPAATRRRWASPCRELIDEFGGGVWKGRKAKAAIPGGISMGLLTEAEFDTPLDFTGPGKVGCLGLGTAAWWCWTRP